MKPEVHNVLHFRPRRTEPRKRVKCAENFVKFGHVILRYTIRQTVISDMVVGWVTLGFTHGLAWVGSGSVRLRLPSYTVNHCLQTVLVIENSYTTTLCLKNVPPLTGYNLDIHRPITIVFGRSVTKKVGNQTVLCFPISPIYWFCTTFRNTKPINCVFHLNSVCCFANKHTKHIQIISWSQLNQPSFPK